MTAWRRNGMRWASWAAAVLAAGYAGLRLGAALPPDGGASVYTLTLLYNYSALPVSILVMLTAITLVFVWLPQALVKAPRAGRDAPWVALAGLAAVAAIWSALPLGSLIYRELATVTTPAATLHLGVRVSADPAQNAYVVSECSGLVCVSHYLTDPSLQTLSPLPELTADAAGRVVVQVAGRRLYEYAP